MTRNSVEMGNREILFDNLDALKNEYGLIFPILTYSIHEHLNNFFMFNYTECLINLGPYVFMGRLVLHILLSFFDSFIT